MRHVLKSALVAETPARMYELINDVERYPQFVPWCTAATVVSRDATQIVASLSIRRALISASFTTRNILDPDRGVRMELVTGPFRSFSGQWTLTAVTSAEGVTQGCKVQLEMTFEFANSLSGRLLEPIFESTAGSLVDAFVARARTLRKARAGA